MIKKILMISDNDITSSKSLGVTKKLLGQYKAFRNLGYDTYHLCFKDEMGVLIHGDETTILVDKKPRLFFTYIKLLDLADKVCRENGIDMCYIRYPFADFSFMKMLKKLHKLCKVVVEIPTYPYDQQNKDLKGLFSKYKIISDKILRKHLKKYNFSFSVIGSFDKIFDIPCINIENGIDVDTINYVGDKISYGNDINLIAVAKILPNHGYDRVIEGFNIYYKNKTELKPNIYFNIVGDGDECNNLKKLVKDYNLQDYVIFHGTKSGEDLDKIFCKSNLAVSILGGHRAGFTSTSVLKSREYCARGIPFIKSLPDPAFPPDVDFCKTLPSCDDPIDINEIVDFYEYVKNKKDLPNEMLEYAKENLNWEKQLKKVLNEVCKL